MYKGQASARLGAFTFSCCGCVCVSVREGVRAWNRYEIGRATVYGLLTIHNQKITSPIHQTIYTFLAIRSVTFRPYMRVHRSRNAYNLSSPRKHTHQQSHTRQNTHTHIWANFSSICGAFRFVSATHLYRDFTHYMINIL